MKQFTLRLDATQQRPVVLLKNSLTALLDTGAYIPIWTDGKNLVRNVRIIDSKGGIHIMCN